MYRGNVGVKFCLLALISILSLGLLAGCGKKPVRGGEGEALVAEQIGESAVGPEGMPGIAEVGMGETEIPCEAMGATAGFGETISEGRTSAPMHPVYFDFDRFHIRDDMKSIMEENALFLLDHPDVMIEIQGNCDERGTNEYNLALGERRAKGAQAYLVNLGVNPDRIGTVSFGEERPLDPGQNEEAWAKDRRDDFVLIK
ncbi:MAG: peptidoglycan-associated lipoprotein Pal [Deltaproteobacteria bacterium]|nr:peptidoglycan-associated lipoprotein Pal [Deltaproteobacteria bacterium]MBW1717943.1 peptidoglycan-associated lipoprotein Pal [Deltaproteobacteria bacterium]MBW1938904.1 peptidoglycan-associated lipoprotein Pal [Deltaproteobacteria bacterium]MBW2079345.1 peptidoglycan-associated lipoprotein Pal [Deltaproteobacteria bacterium]